MGWDSHFVTNCTSMVKLLNIVISNYINIFTSILLTKKVYDFWHFNKPIFAMITYHQLWVGNWFLGWCVAPMESNKCQHHSLTSLKWIQHEKPFMGLNSVLMWNARHCLVNAKSGICIELQVSSLSSKGSNELAKQNYFSGNCAHGNLKKDRGLNVPSMKTSPQTWYPHESRNPCTRGRAYPAKCPTTRYKTNKQSEECAHTILERCSAVMDHQSSQQMSASRIGSAIMVNSHGFSCSIWCHCKIAPILSALRLDTYRESMYALCMHLRSSADITVLGAKCKQTKHQGNNFADRQQ